MTPFAVEITHLLGDTPLATILHPVDQPLRVGSALGLQWRLLGRPMGMVPAALAPALRLSPPLWSEVEPAAAVDLFVPADSLAGEEDHALLVPAAGGPVARIQRGWLSALTVDGVEADADALIASGAAWTEDGWLHLPIRGATAATLTLGDVQLRIRLTRPDAIARSARRVDRSFLGAALSSLGLGLATAWVVATTELSDALAAAPAAEERLVTMLIQPPPPPPTPTPLTRGSGGGSKGGGERRSDDRGGGGKGADDGPSDLFAGLDGSPLDAGLVSGIQGLIGTRGTSQGVADLGGRRGFAVGGPGGPGGLGELGRRSGGPGDLGPGGDLGPRKPVAKVTQPSGEAIVLGSLDPALIDAAIKRRLSSIRYCYSRELQRQPNLYGKVSVKFTINGEGDVASAGVKSSSLGNDRAAQCVVDQVRTIHFPEPKGGGTVIVSYPFLFSPG
jgi:TonB family protein